jgi:hypothetical protein
LKNTRLYGIPAIKIKERDLKHIAVRVPNKKDGPFKLIGTKQTDNKCFSSPFNHTTSKLIGIESFWRTLLKKSTNDKKENNLGCFR